ncbi:MAG: hypothetical protein ABJI44_00140 [Marinomonas sp.]
MTISAFRGGRLVRKRGPFPNKVVMSSGYGRNIVARQLAGDTTYPIEIDSASVGDDNTAPADGNTDLGNALVTDIPITNKSAVNAVITVDVFVADGNLPDDIYEEFGLYCDGRLFSRIIISPAYTKASGEDTLFTYELTLT